MISKVLINFHLLLCKILKKQGYINSTLNAWSCFEKLIIRRKKRFMGIIDQSRPDWCIPYKNAALSRLFASKQ